MIARLPPKAEHAKSHSAFKLCRSTLAACVLCSLCVFLAGGISAHAEHFCSERFGRATNIKSASFRSAILNRTIRYSIYLPPSYYDDPNRTFPVVYYVHGFDTKGLAYQDWLTWYMDEALDNLIDEGNAEEMIVVMPECFATGIVVNRGRRPSPKAARAITFPYRLFRGLLRSIDDPTYLGSYLFVHKWDLEPANYADFFTTELLQHFEENYKIKCGAHSRAVCGFSTGGYSALSIAFRNPRLFGSVSAHAPMLVDGSPFSPDAGKLFVEFDAGKDRFIPQRFTINIFRRIFVEEKTWRENNPIDIARRRPLDGLSVYIDVAGRDKRKYDLGARELVAILKEKGTPTEFVVVPGLTPASSHTYPGFLNGKLIAEHAGGKSEAQLRREFRWKNLNLLINPDVQQIRNSLIFHSKEFSRE